MARPTDGPAFAEGGGNPSTWPAAKETNGYAFKEKLPAEDINGIFENHGEWLQHLERGGHFTDLRTAVAATSAGDRFGLAPLGAKPYRGLESGNTGISAVEIVSVAMDTGRFFLAFKSTPGFIHAFDLTNARLTDPDLPEAVWAGGGLTGSVSFTKIVSNGTYIGAIDDDNTWHVLNAATGASVYTGSHGAALQDCAITDEYFAVVGTENGSNVALRVINLSDGTYSNSAVWATAKELSGVCAVGSTLFAVVGEDDGAGNHVGLFGAAGSSIWRANPTETIAAGAKCASNGVSVFVHNGNTGARLTAFSAYGGRELWTTVTTAADLPALACDVKDVYLATDHDGVLEIFNATTGGKVFERNIPGSGGTQRACVATNSNRVMVGYLNTTAQIDTFNTGVRARDWIRESEPPHFNQAQPEVL